MLHFVLDHLFLIALILLCAFGRRQDKGVWLVLSISSVVFILLDRLVLMKGWENYNEQLLLYMPVELATMTALWLLCANRLALLQGKLLAVAFSALIILYLRLPFIHSFFYFIYPILLTTICILQLIVGYESILHISNRTIAGIKSALPRLRSVVGCFIYRVFHFRSMAVVERATTKIHTQGSEIKQRQER